MEGIADFSALVVAPFPPSTGSYRNVGEVGSHTEERFFLWAGAEQIGDLEPFLLVTMGIVFLPHLPQEAVPRVDGGTLSSTAVWIWMNEAAQQSREPGRPEPQRYPVAPTPSLALGGQ